ncbi:uncharacterized protein LOC143054015 [Mytilus galloprovincialis]|uniref:uncharacterized protein LOC143054015 n=1 Tax=Mytilus galloprovincialis TaxID=29158 RepID=UPI003F7B784B
MIHAGIGETQLNNLLAAMNVHYPHHKSLKSRENEVGDIMEYQANASERKFLLDEAFQSMTIDAEGNEQAGINASTDTCWQKKGSGRAYNSLSGVASLIGEKTGKIVHHTLRIAGCRICRNAQKKGGPPLPHNCKKNWSGTAKGMEPDMVVQLVKDVHEQDININELAGDDDSVGFDRVKKLLPNSKMVKTSDRNHIIINVTKKLYALKPKQKELTPMVINSITKNYSYMLAQNQGSPEKIEKGVRGMIDHMYGKHENCDIKWCGFLKDRASYRHTNLPFGKDLKSESLRADLEKLFLGKIESQSKKLSKLASSQANESFNHTVSTKAAKNKHYSGSSSLNYRVSAAVLQKNEGYGYVSKVSEAAGLSPGNETIKRAIRLNGKRDKKSERAKTKQHKKRRINLKKERSVKSTGVEMREGRTYESEIGMDNEQLDEEIPAPMNASLCIPIDISTAPLVVFDLETTSLYRTSDVIQIAATSSNNEFSSYIFPNQPISIQASEITKITVSANQMFYDLQPVSYKLPHEALTDFITFLSKYPSKPILVGHNIKRFDCHVLYYSLKANQMWNEFSSHVCGFLDTLELFKKIMPGLPSYSQTSLVSHILGENYCAHNAVDDTRALFKLLTSKALNNLDAFVFPVSHPYDCIVQQDNLKSYNEAIACKAVSRATALKASKSNLKLSHLKLSIERMGLEGLKALLSEKTDRGNVRVTNCMKVIRKIFDFLTPES